MALLADFYVSRESRADGYDSNPDAYSYRASHKNLTPLEVSTLWAIVSGREWTLELMDEFQNVLMKDDGERLIHRFPPTLVTELAGLQKGSIGAFAESWAKTDELTMLRSSSADLEPIIEDLARLARHGVEFDSGLYLWNCV